MLKCCEKSQKAICLKYEFCIKCELTLCLFFSIISIITYIEMLEEVKNG